MLDTSMYFKCVETTSSFYQETERFFQKQRETKEKILSLPAEFGIPNASVLAGVFGAVCFDVPPGIKLPKGLKICTSGKRKGYAIPDTRTTQGKKFKKRMVEYKTLSSADYTATVFGAAPMILGGTSGNGRSAINGVGVSFLKKINTIVIETSHKYVEELKKNELVIFPEESLVEITGSEVIILKGKNEQVISQKSNE